MRDDDTVVVNRSDDSKSILRWLLPLLLLLLLGIGLLYYFLIYRNDDTANAPQANTDSSNTSQQNETTEPTTDTIFNLASLLSSPDPNELIGQRVSLASATVDTVIGDKSFTLGSSTDYAYAMLSNQLNSGQTEQAVKVEAGETRSIEGVVVQAPTDTAQLMQDFQLSQEQADEIKEQGFYILVNQTGIATNNDSNGTPTGAGTE